jgi:hypothetical protein
MHDGKRMAGYPSLPELREIFVREFAALPESIRALRQPSRFPVEFSAKLKSLREQIAEKIR